MLDLPPTRAAGLDRLASFAPKAGRDYAAMRNHDLSEDGHPHVSVLSPYIRHRLVTEEEALAAILAEHTKSAAEKSTSEVLWRTYWKGVLERRPQLWADYRAGLSRCMDRLATESGLRRDWEAACLGETGIEAFDHWSREVAGTGYLHNHARMWHASIWIFTLGLPWELGADFYLRHLIDGDPASNTLSWRWVAGRQTVGRTYLARNGNIARYTNARFPPSDRLAKSAPAPEDAAPLPPLRDLDLPEPQPAHGRWGLLIHEDDLRADHLPGGAAAAAAFVAPRDRSSLEISPVVDRWVHAAAEDALAARGGGPVLSTPDAVADWAAGAGLDAVHLPYAPTGWTAKALARAERSLTDRGIDMIRHVRDYDAAAWPLVTAGFFTFKKKAAPILLPALKNAA